VIEVVWTSGGLGKLEIYRRLGVGEFWQWKRGRIQVHLLVAGVQHRRTRHTRPHAPGRTRHAALRNHRSRDMLVEAS
jgi:hypothetical protein